MGDGMGLDSFQTLAASFGASFEAEKVVDTVMEKVCSNFCVNFNFHRKKEHATVVSYLALLGMIFCYILGKYIAAS